MYCHFWKPRHIRHQHAETKGTLMSDQDYDQQLEPYQLAPTVHIAATYAPTMAGGPITMTVDLNVDEGSTLGLDIRAAVQALASVGTFAGVRP